MKRRCRVSWADSVHRTGTGACSCGMVIPGLYSYVGIKIFDSSVSRETLQVFIVALASPTRLMVRHLAVS